MSRAYAGDLAQGVSTDRICHISKQRRKSSAQFEAEALHMVHTSRPGVPASRRPGVPASRPTGTPCPHRFPERTRMNSSGLLTYPVHRGADILFCKANVVPVGRDLPHIRTPVRRY